MDELQIVVVLGFIAFFLLAVPQIKQLFWLSDGKAIKYQKEILDCIEELGHNVENVAKLSGYTAMVIESKMTDMYQKFVNEPNISNITNTLVESCELYNDKNIALKAVDMSLFYNKECNKFLNQIESMGPVKRLIWYGFQNKSPEEYTQKRFGKLIELSKGLKQLNEKYNAEVLSWKELKEMETAAKAKRKEVLNK